MALHRGIQSAIFYYLACTPCAEGRVRKRRQQETERNRVERAALEAHMPGLYVHPEPSTTNPYWQAEIEAGPIPSRNTRKRTADMNRTAKASSTRSNLTSSVSVDASLSMERSDSALSGFGPYQRNDEMLWGSRTSDISGRARPGTHSSSRDGLPARPARAVFKDHSKSRVQNYSQNPAINDLHPPTTRKIQSKEEILWMLQPPPAPEIMSGKTTTQPSRANSINYRPVTLNLDGSSRARSELHHDSGSPSAASSKARANEANHDHDNRQSKYLTVPPRPHELKLTRSRTLPVRQLASDLPQSTAHASVRKTLPKAQASNDGLADHNMVPRRSLSTTLSEIAKHHDTTVGPENDVPFRAGGLSAEPRNRTRNERDAHTTLGATKVSKEHTIRSSSLVETRMLVSTQDSGDEHALDGLTPPEAFDSWTRPDFEFPQWIHDHTKREVRERWSFDV